MPEGSKMECNDYRGILLLNVTHNMFTHLVATYLETYVDEILGDYHCGFRRSRPETDNSCSLRIILEKYYGYCVDIYYLCMQYK
jgi:sorting nexin-29